MTVLSVSFPSIQNVRDTIKLEAAGTSQYSDATIGSNIRTAAGYLERKTNRWLWNRAATTFTDTTNGKALVTIPGLRTATSVTLAETALSAGDTYHLIHDTMQSGLYTGVSLRGFNLSGPGPWWLHVSSYWDRNLDSPYRPGGSGYASVPNDLVIVGDWGFAAGTEPDDLLTACRLLAAHLTVVPDAILGGGSATEGGSLNDLSGFPEFVLRFIDDWKIGNPGVAQA